jgi:hypothetical protein
MATTYQYQKLIEPDTIRLILLYPSPDLDSPLHCNLLSTSLARCHNDLTKNYTALSYVWEDPTRSYPITVDGEPMYGRGWKQIKHTPLLLPLPRHQNRYSFICCFNALTMYPPHQCVCAPFRNLTFSSLSGRESIYLLKSSIVISFSYISNTASLSS